MRYRRHGSSTAIVAFAEENAIDFAVVAPDDPLVLGWWTRCRRRAFPASAPGQNAAIIEGSKVFAKDLMKKYGIPTADYEVFRRYARQPWPTSTAAPMPIVVKADGLALGKGVLICQTREEARDAVRSMMERQALRRRPAAAW